MIAETTSNSAAVSPSAARPADSHPAGLQDADSPSTPGDFEFPTDTDLARALDLPSEGQPTSPDSATAPESDDADATALTGDATAPAEEGNADAAEATPPADDAAAPGDAASAAGAEPDNPATTTADKAPVEAVQARINELTAARKSAEEEAARLREQLAARDARDAGRLDPGALAEIDDPAKLAERKAQWSKLNAWAARHLNADEATLGDKTYSRDQVAEMFAQTSELLTTAAPAREQFLAQRAQVESYVAQAYPWAADIHKGDGAVLQREFEKLPALRLLPNGRLLAADAFVGGALRNAGITVDARLIERLKAEQTKAKPTTAARPATAGAAPVRRLPPSAPARPGTLPPRTPPTQAVRKAALQRLERDSGSTRALEDAIAAAL